MNSNDVYYTLLGKFSQYAMENAFPRYRAQGNNTHPSVRELMYYIAHYTSQKFLKSARRSSVKDCETGDVKYLGWSISTTEKPNAMHHEQRNKMEMLSMLSTFQSVETNEVEMKAEQYVIGFTTFKTIANKMPKLPRRYKKCDSRRMPKRTVHQVKKL